MDNEDKEDKRVEKDMTDLNIEQDDDTKEEAPAEKIGCIYILFINYLLSYIEYPIDLTDPDVEAAAVKIQAAFGKKKAV